MCGVSESAILQKLESDNTHKGKTGRNKKKIGGMFEAQEHHESNGP